MTDAGGPATTRRERVEERERAILAVAEAEFVAHGFDGARMAEIARRVGVAEGTLYLYFRTKTDLLAGVSAAFWQRLTEGAEAAVAGAGDAPTFDRLRTLADFHLTRVMADFALLDLATRLRHVPDYDPHREIDQRRAYVAVFDRLFRQGQDRGDILPHARLWMARDMFYGTLEYAARTMLLHGRGEVGPVVDNLMAALSVYHGRASAAPPREAADLNRIAQRLDRAVTRLEGRADDSG